MIEPATPQLLDLAEAMRGPEWRDELEPALIAAHNAGWTWPRTVLEAVRMACDEDASPRDLTAAVRGPVVAAVDPGFQETVKAGARAELERIRSEARACTVLLERCRQRACRTTWSPIVSSQQKHIWA